MLRDFFQLDRPFETFDEQRLERHFRTSSDLRSVLYEPATWIQSQKKFKSFSFKNVSLSKTFFYEQTFTDCSFEDCLFIGASFERVEFHRCKFTNCNFYKVTFEDCYLDPSAISLDKRYRSHHSNIGVHLFQQLYEDAAKSRQSDFAMKADIQFRRWKRWQLAYDHKVEKIGWFDRLAKSGFSLAYEWLTGYGYRPLRFIIATLILFSAVSAINMIVLPDRIKIDGEIVRDIGFADAIFYTYSMMTVLGFSSIIPQSALAKILAVSQALVGVGWLGLFTSLLVKRFIK
jgi:hypothetical protein